MQAPRGGTELQFEYLRKYVSKDLLDQVQITTIFSERFLMPGFKQQIPLINKKTFTPTCEHS